MIYAEAILICTNIDKDEIGGRIIDEEMKLDAIHKILSMATVNAVKKATLLKIIQWFWDHCVKEEET